MRTRAHHRLLVDLVSTERFGLPGAVVLEHPGATAFSLPGLRPRLVVSSGALEALKGDELAAVLAHERSHLRARHDLVLLPFRSLAAALPRSRALAGVSENLTALVEMVADDRAMRECEPGALARALCQLSGVDARPFASVVGAGGVARRVERALAPRPDTRLLVLGSTLATAVVVMLPFVVLFGPLGGR